MRYAALPLLLAMLLVLPVAAQDETDAAPKAAAPDPAVPQGDNMAVPEGWHFRLDQPNPETRLVADENEAGHDNIFFVNMTPGWHITTGPAAVFYHPKLYAEGTFRAQADIHLFDPGDRNEAFGLFIGGTELDSDDQSYLYFLIRKTGEFLVKRRDGAETSVVHEWTAHPAIAPYTSETEGSVLNVLAVEAGAEDLTFSVNGEEVATVPREDLPVDGLVGLRINHALNVHVSNLNVTP